MFYIQSLREQQAVRQAMARLLTTGYPASLRHVWDSQRAVTANDVAHSAEVAEQGLKVASYNVHKCVGIDGHFNPKRIAAVIRELSADIVALQEVDRRFGDRLGLLDLERIEEETGLSPVPITGLRKAHGWHGNMILVRKATITNVEQIILPGLEPRGALVTDVELSQGKTLRVIGAHFGLLRSSRHKQAEMLAQFIQNQQQSVVLMGDLNEWRVDNGSPLARYTPKRGTAIVAPPSFPSRRPLLPLDRIIASDPDALRDVAVHRSVLARVASDHLPITATWLPSFVQNAPA